MPSQSQFLSNKRPRTTSSQPPATPHGTDHLSSLPLDMQHEILRRLPLEGAVRTSALNKPWRRRWAQCPGLELAFVDEDPPAAVDSVLATYEFHTISVFQLIVAIESRGRVEGWLRSLASKGVKSLILHFDITRGLDFPALPSQIFQCCALTSLELRFCDIPPMPPSFQGFTNLEQLMLDSVRFHKQHGEKTFEALISWSTSLTTLAVLYPTIEESDGEDGQNEEWVLRAPKVEVLDIRSAEDHAWVFGDLPIIKKGFVELEGPHLIKILSGMTRVKELHIVFAGDVILEGLQSYFAYLKDLSLEIPFSMSSTIVSIFCILRNSPNLENLRIIILHEDDEIREVVGMEFLRAQQNAGLFSRLKYVRLDAIIGQLNEMHFIEFVLLKAAQLKKLEVFVDEDSSMSVEMVSSELATYKRACPHAEVIINHFNGYSEETDDE